MKIAGGGLRRAAFGLAVLTVGALIYAYAGLAIRWPTETAPHKYAAEALRPGPTEPVRAAGTWSDPAPGYLYLGSPDGRYLALTRDARRAYHTVFVWKENTKTLQPVVSIQEGDPGSGISYGYRWSADSNALFISGWGALPMHGVERPLSYVYVVNENKLYRVGN